MQLTIFAIASEDPSYRLPEVSKPCTPQATAKAGKYTLAAFRDFSRNIVIRLKQDRQAWTYQESILSGKRLFFCNIQIYFNCYSMKCQEDLAQSIYYKKEDNNLNSDYSIYSIIEIGIRRKLFDIGCCIYRYTSWQLSFESDLLNSIIGILCILEDLGNLIYYFWSVPIFPVLYKANDSYLLPVLTSSKDQFLAGLQQLYIQPAKYCPDFSSWSWTGWIRISCSYSTCYQQTENVSETASTGIEVSIKLYTSNILPQAEFEARKYLKNKPISWLLYLILEVQTIPIRLYYIPKGIRQENITATLLSEIFAKITIDSRRQNTVTYFYPDDIVYKKPKTKKILSSLSFTGILLQEPVVSVEQQLFVLVAEEKNRFIQQVDNIKVEAIRTIVLDNFLEACDKGRKKVREGSTASKTPS